MFCLRVIFFSDFYNRSQASRYACRSFSLRQFLISPASSSARDDVLRRGAKSMATGRSALCVGFERTPDQALAL